MIQNCPMCGKAFDVLWPDQWVFKRNKRFICSWSCLRAADNKKGVEKSVNLSERDQKAVEIALEGRNPVEYLKTMGSKNPSAAWYNVKQKVKETDPETYAKLPARIVSEKKPEQAPEPAEPDVLDSCMYTAIRHPKYGEFYHDVDHNCIDWRAPDGDEMTMDLVGWKNLSRDLPKILKKLGVVL